MVKYDPKDVIRRARIKTPRTNITFRFQKELIDNFRNYCRNADVKMTAVLEILMRDLLEEKGKTGKKSQE